MHGSFTLTHQGPPVRTAFTRLLSAEPQLFMTGIEVFLAGLRQQKFLGMPIPAHRVVNMMWLRGILSILEKI